jgi:hypothetical protein
MMIGGDLPIQADGLGIDAGGAVVSDIIAAGIIPAAVEMMDSLAIRAAEAAVHPNFPDADTVLIDAGIVTTKVFSALILVAVFCTVLAMPLTRLTIGTNSTKEATLGVGTFGLQKNPAQ